VPHRLVAAALGEIRLRIVFARIILYSAEAASEALRVAAAEALIGPLVPPTQVLGGTNHSGPSAQEVTPCMVMVFGAMVGT